MLAIDPQVLARAHDVAAVEGTDSEVVQRTRDQRAQPLEPDLLHEQPQEVLVGQAPLIAQTLVRERLVDVRTVLRVGVQALWAPALRPLAGRADVDHQLGSVDLLGERERARVQRVCQLLVVLGDHAGAGAAGAIQLDQLEVEQRCHLGHRPVQLGGKAATHTTGPVGDSHHSELSSLGAPCSPPPPAPWAGLEPAAPPPAAPPDSSAAGPADAPLAAPPDAPAAALAEGRSGAPSLAASASPDAGPPAAASPAAACATG